MSDTLLLIDDDPEEYELFCSALLQVAPDLQCIALDSGKDAIEKIQKEKSFTPEFIFVDLNMPGLNGKQVLAELKDIDRIRQVPIIIYSTSSSKEDVQETKELGSSGYIVKPASYAALVETLKKVLNGSAGSSTHYFYGRLL